MDPSLINNQEEYDPSEPFHGWVNWATWTVPMLLWEDFHIDNLNRMLRRFSPNDKVQAGQLIKRYVEEFTYNGKFRNLKKPEEWASINWEDVAQYYLE